ncbi:MAG: hypothetical protein P8X57_14765, partial [Cyclobacteriaceae bacterium]
QTLDHMRIISNTSRHILAGGVLFMIPVTILIILVGKILELLRPLSERIEPIFGSHAVLGITSVTIIGIVLMILFCYLAGILLQKGIINFWGPKMELTLFRLFPSLQIMKFMMLPEEDLNDLAWRPILHQENNEYRIAFITDESQPDYYAIFIPDAPRMDAGEIRYIPKEGLKLKEISRKEAFSAIYNYGQGLNIS